MENNWNVIKLGDACNKIGSGITPRGGNSVYKESGIPLIRSQNIYNNYFQYSGIVFIEESVANKMKNVELQEDDVLINITGDSVARCTIVPKDMVGARINQHVSIIRTDKSKLEPYFLKYYLVSDNIQRVLLSMAKEGATRAALTKKMIENIQIKIPDIDTQRKISAISNSFTNKIELNNEMNKTLEEMAQAIFKSWFVDFEPFKDGEFEESELGMIPKGYRAGNVSDLCDVSSSKRIFMADYREEGIPFYRGKEIIEKSKGNDISTEIYIDYNKYREIKEKFGSPQKGDILLTSVGTIGIPYLVKDEEFYFKDGNLTWFKDFKANGYNLYLYYWIKFGEGKNNIDKVTIGSTQKALTISALKGMKIVIPSKKDIKKFGKYMSSVIERYEKNIAESNTLKNIRDVLLPKLISGEINI